MKLYLILLLGIMSLQVTGQMYVEKSFEPVLNSRFTSATVHSNGKIYTTSNSGFAFSAPAWISCIKPDGQINFQLPVYKTDDNYMNDIMESYDHNLLTCGYFTGCDYFPSQFGCITKFDVNGIELWFKTLNPDTISYSADNVFKEITELSNHNLVVRGDSTIFYLNSIGDSIWSKKLRHITSIDHDYLKILVASDSILLVIDNTGSIINQSPLPSKVNYFKKMCDTLYLADAGNVLYTIDTSLTIKNQINLSSINFQADLIKSDDNQICIADSDGSSFAFFDYELQLNDSFHIQNPGISCNELLLQDTTLYIFGEEYGHNSTQFYKSFSTHGNYEYHDLDAAITAIRFDTSYAFQPFQLPAGVHAFSFQPVVTVLNSGTDTIHHVIINSIFVLGGPCGLPAYIKTFDNLQLAPGTSIDLTLDLLTEFGAVFTPPYTYTYCAWVTCPDSLTDKDHSNDMFCDSFTLTEIVSVEEIRDENLTIFPNPANDILNINLPNIKSTNISYSIYNNMCERVDAGIVMQDGISIRELPEGIYYLKLENETIKSVRKFIKINN